MAVMTPGHFIDGFERSFTDCPWRNQHIACDFLNASDHLIWMQAGASPCHLKVNSALKLVMSWLV